MRMILILLTSILLLGTSQTVSAQNYKTSIGARLGPSYGFTLKHFLSQRLAFEGMLTSRYFGIFKNVPNAPGLGRGNYGHWNSTPGVNLTALIEYHFPIGKIDGFNWFIGGGFHLGVWGGYNNHPYFGNNRPYFLTGLDAIGGIEYTFSKIPLTLQLDIKPAFNFFEYLGVWYDEFALSARYTF